MKEEKETEHLLPLVDEVILEKLQPGFFHFLANLQVTLQEGSQDGNEIAIVILKALSQATPLAVQRFQTLEQRVLLALESPVEHDAVHVVVHHELEPSADDQAGDGRFGILPHVVHNGGGLGLPTVAVLLDDLVGEEGHGHDASHLAPVLAVDGEDHVLALAGEDVEHDVAGAGAELHALRVQHLLGEVR
ncbi:hypothetical protein V8G54_035738 [Vigna mungo]|uniref:Uncharacterized protein n=1 Tax=Vigna mungo TaxID=3915 RepID=A0AAQ3MH65_VIGMU